MAEERDPNLPIQGEPNLPERSAFNPVDLQFGRMQAWRRPDYGDEGATRAGLSLRDILYVIFRHKGKIVFAFLLFAIATLYYVASQPQLYKSEARILIRGDRPDVSVDPTASGDGKSFLKSDRSSTQARSEIGIIQSPTLAEHVVDVVGVDAILNRAAATVPYKPLAPWQVRLQELMVHPKRWAKTASTGVMNLLNLREPPLTPRQQAVKLVIKSLEVAPIVSESNVLLITYTAATPELAQKSLAALIDAYLQHHIEIHKTQVSPEFFRQKISETKQQLAAKENELDQARKRLNIISLDSEKTLKLNQFSSFDTRLKENNAQISGLSAKLRSLQTMQSSADRARKASGKPARTSSPAADALRSELMRLQVQEADMAQRYTPEYPDLIAIRTQIGQLKQMLNGEKAKELDLGEDPKSQDLDLQIQLAKAELEAENAREAALTKEVNRLVSQIANLAAHEQELRRLERDVSVSDSEYRQYLNSLQASEISSALDRDKVSNVSIAQTATMPIGTVKSQRKILALAGFGIFFGLFLGIGLAFAIEYCNHSFKTIEDVEVNLGLPVLISLPYDRHHKPQLQEETA